MSTDSKSFLRQVSPWASRIVQSAAESSHRRSRLLCRAEATPGVSGRSRRIRRLVAAAFLGISASLAHATSGGSGTAGDPFQLTSGDWSLAINNAYYTALSDVSIGTSLIIGNGADNVHLVLQTNGVTLEAAASRLTYTDGYTNYVYVTNGAKFQTTTGSINIGFRGTGILTADGGSTVTSGTAGLSIIGYNANANGQVNINTNAAFTTNGSLTLGYDATAQGTLNLDGASATSTIGSTLSIGFNGSGTVTVKNNGLLTTNGSSYVGGGTGGAVAPGTGTVTIDTGGRWVSPGTTNPVVVGYSGAAATATATGTVTVDGSGSYLNDAGDLTVGTSGTGTVTISNSALAAVGGTVSTGVNGAIKLNNGYLAIKSASQISVATLLSTCSLEVYDGSSYVAGSTSNLATKYFDGTNLWSADPLYATFSTLDLTGFTLVYVQLSSAPTVTSPTSASVTASTATLGGNVTSDGGSAVTARGVVYAPTATNTNPQIGGTGVAGATTSGTTGVFVVSATGLTAGTAYTYAAYATNAVGTSYSSTDTFTATAFPVVTAISPSVGSTGGGTTVTITGANFTGATAVTFGATAAAAFTVDSATQITATPPAGAVGAVDITVTTAGGTSATGSADQFTYVAPTLTSNGGGATATVNVAENTASVTTVTATDPDSGQTITYSIIGGADRAKFLIDSSTGALAFAVAPNYEAPASAAGSNNYVVQVQASDGNGGTDTQTITVTVTDLNEAPTVANALADHSLTYGSAFTYTVPASTFADVDVGQTLTCTVSGLPSGVSFDGMTRSFRGTPPVGSYIITVTATDNGTPPLSISDSFHLSVAQADQTIAFTPVDTVTAGQTISLSATATSGLAVTYTLVSGPATLSGGSLTITGMGAVTVRATQAGNANYGAATADLTFAVSSKLSQTITFAALDDRVGSDPLFALSASASSGLPVSFTVVSGPASLDGSNLSLTGAAGTVVIQARQSGNDIYAAAPTVERSFDVTQVVNRIYLGPVLAADQSQIGQLAVMLPPDGSSGYLLVVIPSLQIDLDLSVALAGDGSFVSQSATRNTVGGQLSGNVITGTIAPLGLSFTAPLQTINGPAAALASYYLGDILNSASGTVATIVSASGAALVVAQTDSGAAGGPTTVGADGNFSLQVSGSDGPASVQGGIDAGRTSFSGSISRTGHAKISFAGLSITTARTDRLINLSSRGQVLGGDNIVITGFVITGNSAKSLLLRAIGPGLGQLGVTGWLPTPRLQVYDAQGRRVLAQQGWGDSAELAAAFARLGAFALPAGSADSAVLTTLAPGVYTMHVVSAGPATGIALAEIYDAGVNPQGEYQRLVNISSRGLVGPDAGVLIGGFVITGNSPKQVLVRGAGPALAGQGLTTSLADPAVSVYAADGSLLAENDDWGTPTPLNDTHTAAAAATIASAASTVGAFAFPTGSKDAALIVTLAPGVYTAVVSAKDSATGLALVEIYETP